MRTALLVTALVMASAASAAPKPADAEIAVTAERLSRGALRAQASKFVRATMADARNGQNARWFDPICAAAIGVEKPLGPPVHSAAGAGGQPCRAETGRSGL